MTDRIVTVARRFCGPPNSGNGGYVCGLLGRAYEAPAEVTLRMPPPLDKPLRLSRNGDTLRLMDGDVLVAEARPSPEQPNAIEMPDPAAAERASEAYSGFTHHIFPTCFVCGPKRDNGDGLRIFPGPVPGRNIVAAPWQPDSGLTDENGRIDATYLWAALDCPGFFALSDAAGPAVLGRLVASIRHRPEPGEQLIVAGWPIGEDGRKLYAGTAIYRQSGEVLACGQAVWIQVSGDDFDAA